MIAFLAIFLGTSILIPVLHRWLRNVTFLAAAAIPAAAFVWTALLGPRILSGEVLAESVPWIPQIDIAIAMRMDVLAWIMTLIVTGIGALVLLYCGRYFKPDEPDLGRFAAVLLAFAGVMFGLVLADDIYLLFIFWEATSVLSFLLIGHYSSKRASRGAAMQALLVTTLGGLAMLVGLVMLHASTGTSLLSGIIANPPEFDGFTITAVMLVLAGAVTKSALAPFHFWLPAAMAAPTPVSAYLHAAAMVKAGIYLIARLAPGFAEMPGWREVLITIGVATMLIGGWRSLRQHDLKLILAYGTVSQLGLLTVVVAFGTRDAALAGLAMVIAHACFKAALFLIVGMIDHRTGTRDIRKLSGLAKAAPVLFWMTALAIAAMAGVPPMFTFVAKEAILTALLDAGEAGNVWGWIALVGVVLGTVFTVAYSARFLWGAFASKPDVERVRYVPEHLDFMFSPLVLVIASLGLGFASGLIDPVLAMYADTLPELEGVKPYHLALWHGFEPALFITIGTFILGGLLFVWRAPVARAQAKVPPLIESSRGYWTTMRVVDVIAARTTATTQRGSLPFYLASIFIMFVVASVFTLVTMDTPVPAFETEIRWQEIAIILIMILAAFFVTSSEKRFQGVILVGVTGYGMAGLFALSGAPDLAITQALIETITLVVFVLVLRRLPARHGKALKNPPSWLRWLIGGSVGIVLAVVAWISLASRQAIPDSVFFPEFAYKGGHGSNIVNVTLVDIRGWDTMGELSVLIAAATGVASLVYLNNRGRSRVDAARGPRFLRASRPVTEPIDLAAVSAAGQKLGKADKLQGEHRKVWLIAGKSLAPNNRSIILEVVVRLVFHALLIASLFLLFTGHNTPGGGFAGGAVASLALAARYLAGGRAELDEAVKVDAGRLLGIGFLLATLTALVPIFFGQAPFTSSWIDQDIPGIGQFVFVTSTVFDIGVYLIVIALVIDILRSLGSEIDLQIEQDASPDSDTSAAEHDGLQGENAEGGETGFNTGALARVNEEVETDQNDIEPVESEEVTRS
ncbi:Na+/H+ antiporter subunit A [Pseudoclavibacter helvolus]|uniref:Na+/H+ antiporter subunit A n=1 Tax=Pseudoclavibacter helvolus TaxID=255205 RepID=UPI0009EA808F|nr:Na+/H+ antiporter subunit A [Pseudoclavibacter helvolus]